MKYSRRVAQRVIDGQAFVLDTKEQELHSLNPSGSRIWELAGRGGTPEKIARALADEFEVDYRRALCDVKGFLEKLRTLGLMEDR